MLHIVGARHEGQIGRAQRIAQLPPHIAARLHLIGDDVVTAWSPSRRRAIRTKHNIKVPEHDSHASLASAQNPLHPNKIATPGWLHIFI